MRLCECASVCDTAARLYFSSCAPGGVGLHVEKRFNHLTCVNVRLKTVFFNLYSRARSPTGVCTRAHIGLSGAELVRRAGPLRAPQCAFLCAQCGAAAAQMLV